MPEARLFGVAGIFGEPCRLLEAVARLKASGWERLQAYTPYPVRGLEGALDVKRSPLAGTVLAMALAGTALAWLMQWWMNGVDYPTVVGGKDPRSWQALVPIMFEVMVLFSCLTAALGMLFLFNRLPRFGHPVLEAGLGRFTTRDKFALVVEAGAAAFDAEAARRALREAGAETLMNIPVPAPAFVGLRGLLRLAAAGGALAAAGGAGMYWLIKLWPVLPPMSHMLVQPRLDAQMSSAFFADGRGMRPPAEGSVARGRLAEALVSSRTAAGLAAPLPVTPAVLMAGRRAFERTCVVCHGPVADGTSLLTPAYGAVPANLQARKFLAYSDGMIYERILRGHNAMPGYAWALDDDRRWAVVRYLRALQRAQHAKESDLP
ncbi:MAG: DUF3341 domain-containing protein [Elusimicrobia bacterium]|nr:DUF3341 domain-containing protein [Elusimicrobiota bacterium]